jgi:hypothetical protein
MNKVRLSEIAMVAAGNVAPKSKADTQLAIDKLQMLYDSLAQEYFSIE